jgi:hypothetical protein
MKKLILSLALVAATPAFAWGDREQGALLGLGLGWILSNQQNQVQAPRQVIVNPPVYSLPPVYNNSPSVYNLPRAPQPIYERRSQYDFGCQCYREILVQIGWQ